MSDEWHLYVLHCADGRLYAGISTDPQRRLGEHAAGGQRAAKALRGKGPFAVVFTQLIGSRAEAQRAEYRFKQLTRPQKNKVIDQACFNWLDDA
ncbi:MAG: GIY-YIG nuclease family protein [Gammaproteobacteria bacterium]|nr:GIY-YIG nuclease family protein [Gammaproteobacteria bacterium]NND40046.1 GIY-YIG nuclease family protein [Pseudomonadales bacterium]MBT8150185.1 GIY-YIG nuclease family protein [Gammaproteobacteria bacterium]NNL11235.1 GIY-YIG nuclease family protein [Pseudomonadales bacterium]NNM10922.1 GIY-YIG nuclease family protein [Pseudomonadales bacterium]